MVVAELDQIQTLLEEIAAGDVSARAAVLPLLSAHIVLIPMTEVRSSGERGETKRIKLVTLSEGERKFIPAFTTEDLFSAWSNDRYQCLPIAVEDLALTLSGATEIAVDLGTPHTQSFRAEEFLSYQSQWQPEAPADEIRTEEAPIAEPPADEVPAEQLAEEADQPADYSAIAAEAAAEMLAEDHTLYERPSGAQLFGISGGAHTEEGLSAESVASVTSRLTKPVEQPFESSATQAPIDFDPSDDRAVINELRNLLVEYPDISEAYYTTSGGEHGRGILGVLAEHTDPEKRFNLISSVADLSRSLLGYAGAIDVYDDLNDRQSGSWNLFVALTPFYIRADGRSDFHEGESPTPAADNSKRLPGDHKLVLLSNNSFEEDAGGGGRKGRKRGWLSGFKLVSRR